MSKGPRQLEFHEEYMLNLYFKRLKQIIKTRQDQKRKFQIIDKKVKDRIGKHYLQHWRQELYLKDLDENVAHPHFETKVNLRIKSQVFLAILDYKEKRL